MKSLVTVFSKSLHIPFVCRPATLTGVFCSAHHVLTLRIPHLNSPGLLHISLNACAHCDSWKCNIYTKSKLSASPHELTYVCLMDDRLLCGPSARRIAHFFHPLMNIFQVPLPPCKHVCKVPLHMIPVINVYCLWTHKQSAHTGAIFSAKKGRFKC